MEYAWLNCDKPIDLPKAETIDGGYVPPGYISGLTISEHSDLPRKGLSGFWPNLLYSGVCMPISMLVIQSFFVNGVGFADLKLTKGAATWLKPGDLVLNLNYDTIFEIALSQARIPFTYSPFKVEPGNVIMCKPHGSLNLVVADDESSFTFGQPEWLGTPQPVGFKSFMGIVPPTLNKGYARHPIAKAIIKSVKTRHPDELAFWGVGFTESDADLTRLFARWARFVKHVDVINPDKAVASKIQNLLARPVRQFSDIQSWLES